MLGGSVYRWFTYPYCHFTPFHIVSNMVSILAVGEYIGFELIPDQIPTSSATLHLPLPTVSKGPRRKGHWEPFPSC